jgi:hypothetical protein
MAKKRKKPVTAAPPVRKGKPVRLDLTESDHERLERIARSKGLNKAAFARMAVLEKLKAEEGEY